MGFGKKKRQIREAVEKWNCIGFLGYGQGRAVAEFGQKVMGGKSACYDFCTRANACRAEHHAKMDLRFPQLAQLVESAARIAKMRQLDVVNEVVSAMDSAVDMNHDEALEVKRVLERFKLDKMTDHYRMGQFENIQDGLDKRPPGSSSKLAPLEKAPTHGSLLSGASASK